MENQGLEHDGRHPSSGEETPGVHVPPPLIVAGFLGVGIAADRIFGNGFGDHPWIGLFGYVLVIIGFAIALWAAWQYRKARTSILPHTSDNAMIESGPFRFSRNPIYLSMLVVFVGVCLIMDGPLALIFVLPTWAVLRYYVIAREEQYLIRRFGDQYKNYQRRVRRWI